MFHLRANIPDTHAMRQPRPTVVSILMNNYFGTRGFERALVEVMDAKDISVG